MGLIPGPACTAAPTGYRFLDRSEASFVSCACERLIPAAGECPGANRAGVPGYIDAQLAGPWGQGRCSYRRGPWQTGAAPSRAPEGTPARFFRAALRAIDAELSRRRIRFDAMSHSRQTEFLVELAAGQVPLPGDHPEVFFDLLLQLTVEGFLVHPVHGGTLDRLAWRLRDFPGAHAARARA